MTSRATDRRRFLFAGGAGAMAALGASLARGQTSDRRAADSVVLNATVLTVDGRTPTASAFAVRDGRFIAVGRSEDIRGLVGPGTKVFDAKGMTVVPGFIDCHNHAPGESLLYDVLVGNPYEVEFVTIDSIVEKLRTRAAKTPPGYWVEGQFFDDTKLKSDRPLHRRDLDLVSREHPVAVHHRGGHTVFVNSKALELAGIIKATPNPFGGTFDHDADGELNGRVTDLAADVFDKVGKTQSFTPAETAERARAGLAHISRQFVRYGLTTVHHEGGDLGALQDVRGRGELLHRVGFEAYDDILDGLIREGFKTGFGDEWIRIGATAEHTVDGSFSERTMAISMPYPGVSPPYHGNVTQTQEGLNAWVEKVHCAGLQVNCHANGDVAIDMYLTACERAQALFPRRDPRPKITHCTLVNDQLIRRIKAAGAVPAVFSTYPFYNSDKFKFYGEALLEHCIAIRSMLDAGIPVAAGSDFPPGPFSPLMAIQAMVTRTGWDGKTWGANQRITVEEALRVHTLNGAYNAGEEGVKGSITPGKLADFVVLAGNPLTTAPDKIRDIPIVQTVTGGVVRYSG